MRKSLFISAMFISMPTVMAAIPRSVPTVNVREILSLPADNRVQAALSVGESVAPELLKIVATESETLESRWKSVTLYAALKKEASLPMLNQWSRSNQWFLRNASLVAARTVSFDSAHDMALQLLQDKALVVRSAAVDVLSEKLNAEDRKTLWKEFSANYNFHRQQSLWIRGQILKTLAMAPEKNEKTNFTLALEDKDSRVYAQAVQALEKITKLKLGENVQAKNKVKIEDIEKKRALWIQWARNQEESKER